MTSSAVIAPLSSLTGVIERITFHSEESGYTVARLNTGNVKQLTTIVGDFANVQAGQTLQLQGIWTEHPQYGSQFKVVKYQESKPATLTGIEKYLGSGLIKGVGPVTAKRIVKHFGLETLDIIENQIDRLIEVPGIAKKRIAMIQSTWEEQKSIKEVMIFLQGHGVSTTYAVKIYNPPSARQNVVLKKYAFFSILRSQKLTFFNNAIANTKLKCSTKQSKELAEQTDKTQG